MQLHFQVLIIKFLGEAREEAGGCHAAGASSRAPVQLRQLPGQHHHVRWGGAGVLRGFRGDCGRAENPAAAVGRLGRRRRYDLFAPLGTAVKCFAWYELGHFRPPKGL